NEAGQVVWEWDSEAFGNEAPVSYDGTEVDLRFPGQVYDVETGLYYNWFRYYDAGTGRYVTSDPIGLNGGINTYAYVGGNPVAWVDKLGLAGSLNANTGSNTRSSNIRYGSIYGPGPTPNVQPLVSVNAAAYGLTELASELLDPKHDDGSTCMITNAPCYYQRIIIYSCSKENQCDENPIIVEVLEGRYMPSNCVQIGMRWRYQ
ncbi:MAG: RHS repeat-associated core domain-containing protein, partial [Gammaproteobacteria bacterium]|nr:RHS repeat-associated core domain-containing protein [Gammaproteobacteria bacterium]